MIFSNFYETPVKINIEGKSFTFPSSEHAYQFLRMFYPREGLTNVGNWIIGGKYANYEYIKVLYPGKAGEHHFKKKSEAKMIGLIPKKLANDYKKTGKAPLGSDQETGWNKYWKTILTAKYSVPAMKKLLRKSGSKLLIENGIRKKYKRPIWHHDPWTGAIDKNTGEAYGYNWMGDFLMRIRHQMFPEIPYKPWHKILEKSDIYFGKEKKNPNPKVKKIKESKKTK